MTPIFASWFGCGYLPKMPGTWGTLGAIPLLYVLNFLSVKFALRFDYIVLVSAVVTFLWGWSLCSKVLYKFKMGDNHEAVDKNDKKKYDPSWIVIDEVAGFLLTISLVFWGAKTSNTMLDQIQCIVLFFASFMLFRIYDILKPWPIYAIETWMSIQERFQSLSIMLDDIIAAVMAAATIYMVFYWF